MDSPSLNSWCAGQGLLNSMQLQWECNGDRGDRGDSGWEWSREQRGRDEQKEETIGNDGSGVWMRKGWGGCLADAK